MEIKTTPKGHIAWCQDGGKALSPDGFTMVFWQSKQGITGESKGRYTTWFISPKSAFPDSLADQEWVLRHYWRGGLMEKFSRDAYFYTGLNSTRAVAELQLLEVLFQEGFAVPRPIAANIERFGLWCRGDIIIERIEGACDLVAQLSHTPMTAALWSELGKTIAIFHQRGVYHADLNAKNILIADDKFYLIDFDRGELRPQSARWQQANIARLLRSFKKEQAKLPSLAFDDNCWQQLITGYEAQIKFTSFS